MLNLSVSALRRIPVAQFSVGANSGHLIPSQLLLQLDLAPPVDAVNLKHILGQVDANSRSLHCGRPFRFKWLVTLPLWHVGAGTGGGIHPIGYGDHGAQADHGWRGKSEVIRCDNGQGNISEMVRRWADEWGIRFEYILASRSRVPTWNGATGQCARMVSQHHWRDLGEAMRYATNWMWMCNPERPNMALRCGTPKQQWAMTA